MKVVKNIHFEPTLSGKVNVEYLLEILNELNTEYDKSLLQLLCSGWWLTFESSNKITELDNVNVYHLFTLIRRLLLSSLNRLNLINIDYLQQNGIEVVILTNNIMDGAKGYIKLKDFNIPINMSIIEIINKEDKNGNW